MALFICCVASAPASFPNSSGSFAIIIFTYIRLRIKTSLKLIIMPQRRNFLKTAGLVSAGILTDLINPVLGASVYRTPDRPGTEGLNMSGFAAPKPDVDITLEKGGSTGIRK